MLDVADLAKRLIAAPSVTPATGAVFDELAAMLTPLGFAVHRFVPAWENAGMFLPDGLSADAFSRVPLAVSTP